MLRRVYPIRTTRNKWKIPLFCYHKCSERCNIIIITNQENQYILLQNPDYVCPYNNKINETTIPISLFDINDPKGSDGVLHGSETKVILDNEFFVSIYFPLSYVFEVLISTPSNNGFTLKELIYSIKNLYEFIYQEEERTASTHVYQLKKFCTNCGNKDLTEYIEKVIDNNKNESCSICYCDYIENNEDSIKLKCNHIYHETCIKTWLEKCGTCPICRYNVFECDNCDGTGIIYYSFTGIVIPIEHRNEILNRNRTDGIFGVYAYDLEDLLIESMSYDRNKKRLYLNIIA
jgi:hypothetical protein